MNELIYLGKKRTILIAISIILFSLYTIYFEQTSNHEIDSEKLIKQIIRFCLTIGLLYLVFIVKNWARILAIVLFILAIIGSITAIVTIKVNIALKIPFFVLIFIYGMAIYHFSYAKSFKAYWESLQSKNKGA